jgi:hypothetical protein
MNLTKLSGVVVIVAAVCACERTHEVSEFDNIYVGRLNDDCYADVRLRAHVTTDLTDASAASRPPWNGNY